MGSGENPRGSSDQIRSEASGVHNRIVVTDEYHGMIDYGDLRDTSSSEKEVQMRAQALSAAANSDSLTSAVTNVISAPIEDGLRAAYDHYSKKTGK